MLSPRKGVAVADQRALVRPRHEAHAAVRDGDGAQRQPGADHALVVFQAPVAQILMPADEPVRLRFLDEKGGAPDHDIGPEDRLHRVQDFRAGVRFSAANRKITCGKFSWSLLPTCVSPRLRFEVFQPVAILRGAVGGEHVDGEAIAVLPVIPSQFFCGNHNHSPALIGTCFSENHSAGTARTAKAKGVT